MRWAASTTSRMLKRVGIYNGLPRILNFDSSQYTIGYTKINTMATTAFSRTKSHKAWLVGTTDIRNGTRIIDRVDNVKYIVMSLKAEFIDGDIAYYDGTLFYVNDTCTVSRLNPTLDAFGRNTATSFTSVTSNVWIMVNPIVIDVIEQPDNIHNKDKIKIAMQSSVDIKDNDRLTTSTGEKYQVMAYSRAEIDGLVMVYAETDTR